MHVHVYRLVFPYLKHQTVYAIARLYPACAEWYLTQQPRYYIITGDKKLSKVPLLAYYGDSALTRKNVLFFQHESVVIISCVRELEIFDLVRVSRPFSSYFNIYYIDAYWYLCVARVTKEGTVLTRERMCWDVYVAHIRDEDNIFVQCGCSILKYQRGSWLCVWERAPEAQQLRSFTFGSLQFLALLDRNDILYIYSLEGQLVLATYPDIVALVNEGEELIYLTHEGYLKRWLVGLVMKDLLCGSGVVPFLNTYLVPSHNSNKEDDVSYFHLSQYLHYAVGERAFAVRMKNLCYVGQR